MESQIKYNLETTLTVPPDCPLSAILVTVEIDPAEAGCLIYGRLSNGDLGYIEVRGSKSDVELPFVDPKVYVAYLRGLQSLRISPRGWKEAR
jgi:hypothetical protein